MVQEQSADSQTFIPGTIIITAQGDQTSAGLSASPGKNAMRQNRIMLDDALRGVPGGDIGNAGDGPNEKLVYAGGFDHLQVSLSIAGIRVYLPADNRLDYGRFLTAYLSETQVQKGHVSVLNGPGGVGGAINLMTRLPSTPFEGETAMGIKVS